MAKRTRYHFPSPAPASPGSGGGSSSTTPGSSGSTSMTPKQRQVLGVWVVTGIAVGAIVYFYKQDKAKKQKAAQLALQKTLAVPLALFKAGEEGNLDAVMAELSKEQVGKGFVLWQKNVNNILFKNATQSPLYIASCLGLLDIVKLLLADKDIKVNQTKRPVELHHSILQHKMDILIQSKYY